jgi:ribosomal protein L32
MAKKQRTKRQELVVKRRKYFWGTFAGALGYGMLCGILGQYVVFFNSIAMGSMAIFALAIYLWLRVTRQIAPYCKKCGEAKMILVGNEATGGSKTTITEHSDRYTATTKAEMLATYKCPNCGNVTRQKYYKA